MRKFAKRQQGFTIIEMIIVIIIIGFIGSYGATTVFGGNG